MTAPVLDAAGLDELNGLRNLRAISIRQPWAARIFDLELGPKDVENRSQPVGYRGPIIVHTGLQAAQGELDVHGVRWSPAGTSPAQADDALLATYELRGAFLGVVDVVDCHAASRHGTPPERRCCASPWGDDSPPAVRPVSLASVGRPRGPRSPMIYHLTLAHPRLLAEPIPGRGQLGTWTPLELNP